MQLEIIIPSEVIKRKTNTIWYHLYVQSKNEPIYETETENRDSQTQRTDFQLPRSKGFREGWSGRLGLARANYYIQNR